MFEPRDSGQVDQMITHLVNGYTFDAERDYHEAKVTILLPRRNSAWPFSISNAITAPFGGEPYNGAVFGLYGCTSVIVVSRKGVWLSHFYEAPTFEKGEEAMFDRDVLDAMSFGDGSTEMPPLGPLTNSGGVFIRDAQPEAIILTPDEGYFTIHVNRIIDELEWLMPQVPITVHRYSRPEPSEAEDWLSPLGKAVVQYDPDCLGVHDGGGSCGDPPGKPVLQLACAKVWMGGTDKPLLDTWWQYNNT